MSIWTPQQAAELQSLRALIAKSRAGQNTPSIPSEPYLGLPAVDGYVVSSTVAGVRSWIVPGSGPTGADGKTWYSGTGAPSTSLGVVGDFYLDDASPYTVYKKTGASTWASQCTLLGPAGADGADGVDGADGTNGTVWYHAAGTPSTLHNDGDLYLNDTNQDLYQQAAGAWGSPITNIKGATGATGADGPNNITTSTTTNLTGLLRGNGSVVSADTSAYLTSLTGAVLTDQTAGQTIGATGARLTKLWATDITVTNAITGAVTGNAGTVTNGVYTTDAGTVFLAPAGDGSSLSGVLHSLSGAVLTDQTSGQTIGATGARLTKLWATDVEVTNAITGSITGNAATSTKLAATKTIAGVAFDGSGNIDIPIDGLSDVAVTTPALNDHLIWNGTNFVNAPSGTTFTFSIASFADDQSATVLIGSGNWKTTGNINFTASYNNGPPTSCTITIGGTGSVTWANPLTLSTPYTSGASAENTAYPSAKDTTITFTLTPIKGSNPTSVVTHTFRNNVKYGTSTATSWDSAAVNAFSGTTLSSTYTGTIGSITASTNDYVMVAHPSSYTSLHATGFLFNSVACPFQSAATVSVTNSAGFTENYKVYRSTSKNLGTSSLVVSTSSNIIDPIYYGISTTGSSFTEGVVEALATSTISNTKGRTFSVSPSTNDYIVYALPVRLGTVTFTVGGFAGGFNAPETVSVTNVNGYAEDYYVYGSVNKNLGTVSVVVT